MGQAAWQSRSRLRKASADAPETLAEVEAVEEPLTTAQAMLLLRYVGARWLLAWLQGVFVVAYIVVVVVGMLLWLGFHSPGLVIGALLLLVTAIVQWRVTRRISRLGALRRLRALDSLAEDAIVVWWPNLQRELRRVGLGDGAGAVLGLVAGLATNRLGARRREAFDQIRWAAVLPQAEWRQARRILADAAA
jgi:hypothetical protein